MLSRHLRAAGRRGLVALTALVCIGLTGCDRGGDSSGVIRGPSGYHSYDASGDRVMVRGADGKIELKIRRRHRGYKVYGADLVAEGFVYEPGGSGTEDAGGGEESSVRIRPMAAASSVSLAIGEAGSWGLGERFRVEQTGRGLAVFGSEADWLGRFEHSDEGGWQLVRGSERERIWSVERQGYSLGLVSDQETKLTVDETDLPPEVLLALGVDELSPLERVALGVWLRHRGPAG